jgi:hypothetical protein
MTRSSPALFEKKKDSQPLQLEKRGDIVGFSTLMDII